VGWGGSVPFGRIDGDYGYKVSVSRCLFANFCANSLDTVPTIDHSSSKPSYMRMETKENHMMLTDPNNLLPLALLSVAAIATIHLLVACYRCRPDTRDGTDTDSYWAEIDAELAELDKEIAALRRAAQ